MQPHNPQESPRHTDTSPYDPNRGSQIQHPQVTVRYRQPSQPSAHPSRYRLRSPRPRRRLPRINLGCVVLILCLTCIASVLAVYLLFPARTNILLLGIDYTDPGNATARTDSIVLFTFDPLKPTIGMLSIPRDLWVTIPGVGENRINTTHFYAENLQPDSGPAATMEVVSLNFGVNIDHYLRIRFEGFREIVDALGGVDLTLNEPMAGYPAGKVHLTGKKALAFVRDRTNTDDFFRMSQGQVMLKALFKNTLNPLKWPRLPAVFKAFFNSVDTSLPAWEWPRLAVALLRAGPEGIESHIITRDMVNPYVTDQGANVLLPNWAAIRPLVKEVFGQ